MEEEQTEQLTGLGEVEVLLGQIGDQSKCRNPPAQEADDDVEVGYLKSGHRVDLEKDKRLLWMHAQARCLAKCWDPGLTMVGVLTAISPRDAHRGAMRWGLCTSWSFDASNHVMDLAIR